MHFTTKCYRFDCNYILSENVTKRKISYLHEYQFLSAYLRGLFEMLCVLYDISKSFDSKSEMNITPLQSILLSLKYIISISEYLSKMRHGTLHK